MRRFLLAMLLSICLVPSTALAVSHGQWLAEFQRGHVFDQRHLDWQNRWYLKWAWHVRGPWWGPLGLNQAFAAIYADCSFGWNDKDSGVIMIVAQGAVTAYPSINTCAFIRRVFRLSTGLSSTRHVARTHLRVAPRHALRSR